MDKNKKLLILSGLIIITLIIIFLIFFDRDKINKNPEEVPTAIAPVFLDDSEKQQLGVPVDMEIQDLGRGDNGELLYYRVVKDETDIILDSTEVPPASPRRN